MSIARNISLRIFQVIAFSYLCASCVIDSSTKEIKWTQEQQYQWLADHVTKQNPALKAFLLSRAATAANTDNVPPIESPTDGVDEHTGRDIERARALLVEKSRIRPYVRVVLQPDFDCWVFEETQLYAGEIWDEERICRPVFLEPREVAMLSADSQEKQIDSGGRALVDIIVPRQAAQRHAIVYFESGKTGLSAASRYVIDDLVLNLEEPSRFRLNIISYADQAGSPSWNLRLPQERADAVAKYLIDRGAPPHSINILAGGDQDPKEDISHAKQNRRVEIIIEAVPSYANTLTVLSTVYDLLNKPGDERDGYGLYSYVLFPYYSERVSRFLEILLGTTHDARKAKAWRSELNVLLIPTKNVTDKQTIVRRAPLDKDHVTRFASLNYDYEFSESILMAVCRNPHGLATEFCSKARGAGPVLATYSHPISQMREIPPPYLIADFSNYNTDAMLWVLNAYKEQVMRPDFTDRERLESFRLNVLNWILFARDAAKELSDAVPDLSQFIFSRIGNEKR